MKIRHSTTAIVAAAAAMTMTAAAPATTHARHDRSPIEITSGEFTTLPGGTAKGFDIQGRAVMIRLPHRTLVAVRVRGLEPSTTHPTHVHNQPCSYDPPGGSHYQDETGGPVDAVNEIWPTVTTNRFGRGHGHAKHGHRARPEAQSIVIHYSKDDPVRLACVDLA